VTRFDPSADLLYYWFCLSFDRRKKKLTKVYLSERQKLTNLLDIAQSSREDMITVEIEKGLLLDLLKHRQYFLDELERKGLY